LRFTRFVTGTLIFNLAVILWGAYVRASGSGAGCGSHWPLCNGEILPRAERIQTAIEFTHRLSSGICLILAVAVAVWGWKRFPAKHPARRASIAVFAFTISEALIGAMLVLLGHVAQNQSAGRALSISMHLANTLILLASLVLTIRWSQEKHRPSFPIPKESRLPLWLALGSTIALGITGALTALGDTLFKSATLVAGMREDFEQHSHFLVKLRVIHPALALAVAIILLVFSDHVQRKTKTPEGKRAARLLQLFVFIQLVIGAANLGLMAPTTLQLVHLFVADTVWITAVWAGATLLDTPVFP
jgi:cytochrome c oxidase assembly protein subunit 15